MRAELNIEPMVFREIKNWKNNADRIAGQHETLYSALKAIEFTARGMVEDYERDAANGCPYSLEAMKPWIAVLSALRQVEASHG